MNDTTTAPEEPIEIKLSAIRLDVRLQSRVNPIDEDRVDQMAEVLDGGADLPPIEVIQEGDTFWPINGYHRLAAHEAAGLTLIQCYVTQGTFEDALWAACSANKEHDKGGLPRTNADKKRAIETALAHPKAAKMSDAQIATHVGVSRAMVQKYRPSTCHGGKSREGKDGRTINTAAIGKTRPAAPEPTPFPDETPDDLARRAVEVTQAADGVYRAPEQPAPEPTSPLSPVEEDRFKVLESQIDEGLKIIKASETEDNETAKGSAKQAGFKPISSSRPVMLSYDAKVAAFTINEVMLHRKNRVEYIKRLMGELRPYADICDHAKESDSLQGTPTQNELVKLVDEVYELAHRKPHRIPFVELMQKTEQLKASLQGRPK